MKSLILGLALSGSAALSLAAQGTPSPRLEGRVPPDVARAVTAIVDSASHAGLPVELLLRKALEGGAKGVPNDRIIGAVRVVSGQLAAAAKALDGPAPKVEPEAIEAGAFAINAGLSPDQVHSVAQAARASHSQAGALRTAGTLVAIGVPPGRAVALVEGRIRAGGSAADVLQLPEQVQSAVGRGATPAQAAEGLGKGAGQGPPAGHPDLPPKAQGKPRRP
jgi:hypothetical protein